MAFVMIFGVCGMAFARGGGPDPGPCTELPQPDAGFFLRGEFTVSQCPFGMCFPEQSVVHIFLKKGNQTELFMLISSPANFCDSTLTGTDLLEIFKYAPCILDVSGRFDLLGVGVITNIEILQTSTSPGKCGTPDEMMRGEIVIRVVPPKPAVE